MKRKTPLWIVFLADLAAFGVALCAFAYFHHVRDFMSIGSGTSSAPEVIFTKPAATTATTAAAPSGIASSGSSVGTTASASTPTSSGVVPSSGIVPSSGAVSSAVSSASTAATTASVTVATATLPTQPSADPGDFGHLHEERFLGVGATPVQLDDDTAIRCIHCSDGDVEYDRGNSEEAPGVEVVSSEGFAYEKIAGEQAYALTGIGECTALDISIPDEYDGMPVTHIADGAFSGNTALHTVTLPDSITYIGSNAFNGCTSLTSVIVPQEVSTIEMCTFMGCSELSTVIIEGGVKTIDVCAFAGCEKLTEVTFTGTKEAWQEVENNSWKWSDGSAIETVHCTDGDFEVSK
jgi:hypothetical protein